VDALSQEHVQDGASRVLGLQFVLPIQRLEQIIGRVHRQLAGVGVIRLADGTIHPRGDDVGIEVAIQHGEPVARPFRWRGLQVEHLPRLFLVALQALAHIVHHPSGKLPGAGIRQIHAHKVEASLVHAVQADGVEMIRPVLAKLALDRVQIVLRVRVEPGLCELLDHPASDHQRIAGNVHQVPHAIKELLLIVSQVADAGHVEGYHTNAAGEGIGAKQPAPALAQLAVIEPQAAAHGPYVIRVHVRVHKVGKVRDAVLGCHLPDGIEIGVIPVKVPGDVVGRDGKGKDAPVGVAFLHQLCKTAIQEVHLRLELAIGLFLRLAADDHILVGQIPGDLEIKAQVRKWSLEANARGHVQVKDEFLQSLADLSIAEMIIADKGGKERVEIGKGHRSGGFALDGVEKVHDLSEGRPEMLGGAAVYLARYTAKAADQQVSQIPAAAVHRQNVEIVEVDISADVGLTHLFGKDPVQPIGAVHRRKDVVVEALQGKAHVRVLFDSPIELFQITIDQLVRIDESPNIAQLAVQVAVEDIGLGRLGMAIVDEGALHQVLNVLDGRYLAGAKPLVEQLHHGIRNKDRPLPIVSPYGLGCLEDRVGDLFLVKGNESAVPLANMRDMRLLHGAPFAVPGANAAALCILRWRGAAPSLECIAIIAQRPHECNANCAT